MNEFLEVMGHSFRSAEILHVLGHFGAHFFSEAEEVVDAILARHHHGLEFFRAEAVFTEFFFGDRFYVVKRPPIDLNTVFLLDVVVG